MSLGHKTGPCLSSISILCVCKQPRFWLIGIAPIKQVRHMYNKNSNIQGRSLNVIKEIFRTIKNCS